MFARWFTPRMDAAMPACPSADHCAWDVASVRAGQPGCVVRRLGLICAHQAGLPGVDPDVAEWETWNMADPDDADAWGT
jgi:hypothetical protein